MKRLLRFIVFLICISSVVSGAHSEETCYIDDSPLLLYKTINWWYDSLPEESGMLCGKPIKCINESNASVEYDEGKKRIEIVIRGGLANMLSIFKKCDGCYGPSTLHNLSINPDYFMNSKATIVTNDLSSIHRFRFDNIEKEQARLLKSIEATLIFSVEGEIGGLCNGQIALHESGELLRHCRGPLFGKYDHRPICIKIINKENNKIVAEFTMLWR